MWSPNSRSEQARARRGRGCSRTRVAAVDPPRADDQRREVHVGVDDHRRGRHRGGVDDRDRALRARRPRASPAPPRRAGRSRGARRRGRRRAAAGRRSARSAMRRSEITGPPFCARPVWSSPAALQAVEQRGHLEDLRDRDDAGAADAGHPHAACRRRRRAPARRSATRRRGGVALPSPSSPAYDRQERRAVALEAGEVLVAGGLVDPRLAAELGLDRQDRQAGRLLAAVAAALADALVDPDALRPASASLPRLRSRRFSAAQPSSWISTVTPVDAASSALRLGEVVAVAHLGDRRRARRRGRLRAPAVVTMIRAHALDREQARDRRDVHPAAGGPGRRSSRRRRCRAACR